MTGTLAQPSAALAAAEGFTDLVDLTARRHSRAKRRADHDQVKADEEKTNDILGQQAAERLQQGPQ